MGREGRAQLAGGVVNGKQLEQANRVMSDAEVRKLASCTIKCLCMTVEKAAPSYDPNSR